MLSYKGRFQAPRKKHRTPARKQISWSSYQQNIFNDAANGNSSTIILASPGSGKSTTILESLYHVPQEFRTNQRTLYVAFNSSIAAYLDEHVPNGVAAMTFHKLGFQTVRDNLKNIGGKSIDVKGELALQLATEEVGSAPETEALRENLAMAMDLAKTTLCENSNDIENVMAEHGIQTRGLDENCFAYHVHSMMEKTKQPRKLNGKHCISFGDMLWLPHVHGWQPKKYDRVFVDEAQDLSASRTELILKAMNPNARLCACGDKCQCISVDTQVNTPNGTIKASDLKVGDRVLSWRKAKVTAQTVTNIAESDWEYGYKITTASGKSLSMSPNHKIWATEMKTKDNQVYVYLMYRPGFGFRIGITNKGRDAAAPYGNRITQEGAERLWIIEVCENREDALFWEEYYSLCHGIPTMVFNGTSRGLNQKRINDLFKEFGNNGIFLLKYKDLDFEFPHWIQPTSMESGRKAIRFCVHGRKNGQITMEWGEKNECLEKALIENGFVVAKGSKASTKRIRKYLASYMEGFEVVNKLHSLVPGSVIIERLYTPFGSLRTITASALRVGMCVPAMSGETVVSDEIISVEKINGKFLDLEVTDAANFFGNGILSHNSIMGFAGATSNIIDQLQKTLHANVLPLSVSYRCPKSMVRLAQAINPNIEAAKDAIEGTIESIPASQLYTSLVPGAAILSRTNYPLVTAALALARRGIKANIQGKDIGQRFLWRISTWKPNDVSHLVRLINEWKSTISAILIAKGRSTGRIEDEAESILRFTVDAKSVQEVQYRIGKFFSDDPTTIKLSSTHKAKGLEWNDVYLLEKTYHPGRSEEDNNIWYVGITRSRSRLVFVSGNLP